MQTTTDVQSIRQNLYLLQHNTGYRCISASPQPPLDYQIIGSLPPLYPEWLGNPHFLQTHQVRFCYIAGAMANGIASSDMVVAMARAKMLGFFGAAGLSVNVIESALQNIESRLGNNATWGSNLIHTPTEPETESKTVDLYIKYHIKKISISAFMAVNHNIVRLACHGLKQLPDGRIVRRHHLFAKISQPNIAKQFMSPPSKEILNDLLQKKLITTTEAQLAQQLPIAEDITVEADSGGHTDNRPLPALLSVVLQLRDQMMRQYQYKTPIRIGAAGGLGTPRAVAAAFAMGADYVVTGSINQASVEAALSTDGKKLLAAADLTDVIMAPAADMFELGVKLQVLKRGTLFAMNAAQLYRWYEEFEDLNDMPTALKEKLEKRILKNSIDSVWQQTIKFFEERNPQALQAAIEQPKKKMALIFRWYLGKASRWAIQGLAERRGDYQIWCGPAMGAFNAWVKNSFLADLSQRHVVQMALNLLEGAAVVQRAQQIRSYGISLPIDAYSFKPTAFALPT